MPVPREAQDVTEAELALMQVLWDRGPASIRQLTDLLHPRGGQAQYATIQKQLERLEAKGFVKRDRSLFVHLFEASVDRDELIGRRIRQVMDQLCGGSVTPLISHLARAGGLTEAQRKALREIVADDAGRERPRTRKGTARED
jgi:predicted transcriptional regulator